MWSGGEWVSGREGEERWGVVIWWAGLEVAMGGTEMQVGEREEAWTSGVGAGEDMCESKRAGEVEGVGLGGEGGGGHRGRVAPILNVANEEA